MMATTVSSTGMMTNNPAPLTLCSFPILKITNFCQTFAIFKDEPITTATANNATPIYGLTKKPAPAAAAMKTNTRKEVMGFICASPYDSYDCSDCAQVPGASVRWRTHADSQHEGPIDRAHW